MLILRSIETLITLLLKSKLVVAKSGLPSPSISPIADDRGVGPVIKSTFVAKLIVPLLLELRNIETKLLLRIVIVKSGLPSPSRSPIANEFGPAPVGKFTLVAKLKLPGMLILRKI